MSCSEVMVACWCCLLVVVSWQAFPVKAQQSLRLGRSPITNPDERLVQVCYAPHGQKPARTLVLSSAEWNEHPPKFVRDVEYTLGPCPSSSSSSCPCFTAAQLNKAYPASEASPYGWPVPSNNVVEYPTCSDDPVDHWTQMYYSLPYQPPQSTETHSIHAFGTTECQWLVLDSLGMDRIHIHHAPLNHAESRACDREIKASRLWACCQDSRPDDPSVTLWECQTNQYMERSR